LPDTVFAAAGKKRSEPSHASTSDFVIPSPMGIPPQPELPSVSRWHVWEWHTANCGLRITVPWECLCPAARQCRSARHSRPGYAWRFLAVDPDNSIKFHGDPCSRERPLARMAMTQPSRRNVCAGPNRIGDGFCKRRRPRSRSLSSFLGTCSLGTAILGPTIASRSASSDSDSESDNS
jgi:hypothetical protein